MLEEEKECQDVITQLSAARTAIDRMIGTIVSLNLIECIQKSNDSEVISSEEIVQEAVNLLVKSR